MLRNWIRSLLGRPNRLEDTRNRITLATLRAPHKIGTWKCVCGHTNNIYHLAPNLHLLGMMACTKKECGLTWHPSLSPIASHHLSDLMVKIILPDPKKPNEGDAPYVIPYPNRTALKNVADGACPAGYGYICLHEGCGLSWAAELVHEWPWGKGRKVMAIAGRRFKGSCLCGKPVQVGGGFAVFDIVRRL